MVLGLTGGIGAGKSMALAAFRRRGCPTLSSDEVVHGLYATAEVRDAVVARFGRAVLDESGEVDRTLLAPLAFADPAARGFLETLLHPLVAVELERFREAHADDQILVHEVPLLYEAGLADRYDAVVVITAPDDVRRLRAPGRFDERSSTQLPEAGKVELADYVIVNDGDPAQLDAAVGALLQALRR